MEHQVFVPAPAERIGAALADRARVARAVPGLQQDAGAEPITGRLKLRVGGHSVTYRGTARVTAREDGTYAVVGDATEARGTGAVKLALTLRLADTEGGCTVTAEGTVDATGRISELPAETVTAAATRLLNRFLESLAAGSGAGADTGAEERPKPPAGAPHTSVFETEIPPSALSPDADADEDTDTGTDPDADTGIVTASTDRPSGDFAETDEPPAEAAHARRTMIGRSAEEVDHAPPRGRYAPVPAPQTVTATSALRWAAPAAALVVASAIVVSKALRKRR
ncbi:carbon monoxide dehydrogenase subunit G [Streptomyces sp. Ru62]|uniref:SRPBCC family protein n=1 Tax=Streptomyces sp. Ru62 TaxID=2080745 RepID=UPI000CDDCB5F|nr:SRPBCC family protein [Streptomyces sp. Ru62]POX60669.1 carbon monoxide dehydrogenase subunit G [Streptomyces sp. Ru62]